MLDILIMLDSVAIIMLTLLQSGKSAGVSSAFTGGNGGLNLLKDMKERGPEKALSLATLIAGFLFFIFTEINHQIRKASRSFLLQEFLWKRTLP